MSCFEHVVFLQSRLPTTNHLQLKITKSTKCICSSKTKMHFLEDKFWKTTPLLSSHQKEGKYHNASFSLSKTQNKTDNKDKYPYHKNACCPFVRPTGTFNYKNNPRCALWIIRLKSRNADFVKKQKINFLPLF